MAIYKTLSLASGGGILSRSQQAAQAQNTATVLIGLGGTGIDALRTVKTQVHQHLQPDDPAAVRPEYAHIRFLGIDTAAGEDFSRWSDGEFARDGLLPLDRTEYFSIANRNIGEALSNRAAMETRHDLNWLYWERIVMPSFGRSSASGTRQIGRFLLMDKSEEFAARLETEIDLAKQGLNSPEINIHILTGLCGATGSGCFLDVCYLVRDVLARCFPENTAIVSGYFYLPDVSLDRVPRSNSALCRYLPQNGCAALRELDYCMGFPGNGGAFTQEYQNRRRVDWREPPVDFCFLLGASDEQGTVIPNAYRHAIDVTADHLLGLLGPDGGDRQQEHFLPAVHIAPQEALEHAFPDCGNIRYCTLGSAAAEIPHREINTYLASHLFERFSVIQEHAPSQRDVEGIAIRALAKGAEYFSDVYDYLLRELRKNAEDDYDPYPNDWKDVRDHGCNDFLLHYSNQTAGKLGQLEANAKKMTDQKNRNSLLGRLRSELELAIRDIDRGPAFAYRALTKAQDHNLLNLIDGLIAQNHAHWAQEAAFADLRREDYDNAKADFDANCTRPLAALRAPKLFQTYEWYLMLLEQHKLAMNAYDQMDTVLKTLRKQVEGIHETYYVKLARVMGNLIDTFSENRVILAWPGIRNGTDSFAAPVATIAELEQSLDAEVEKLHVPNLLDAFMAKLLADEEVWIEEDENKITRFVSDFCTNSAFPDFTDRGITAFLQDKYNTADTAQLANFVYNGCIRPLSRKAELLIDFDAAVWPAGRTPRLSFLSVPTASAPVTAAAQRLNTDDPAWTLTTGAFPDRVSAVRLGIGLPIRAHRDCKNWERAYAQSSSVGLHSYEGKPIPGMPLDDWRKLPPLIPDWDPYSDS